MKLRELIIERIRCNGPISFRDFMDMALYYPELGYYTSTASRIGVKGDYYTSPCLTPAFGAMIGRQLEEMWRNLGSCAFTVIEYGAGNCTLCRDILRYLEGNLPFYDQLTYYIIEKGGPSESFASGGWSEKVIRIDSICDIPAVSGCILSNELVDNFPVHRVQMSGGLMELFVDYKDDFVEVLLPAKEGLGTYLQELNVSLPAGFRTEINLDAVSWMKEISSHLKVGYVLTIDYGFESEELYCNCRGQGTLVGYRRHNIGDLFFEEIGSQDITSHVNFSALRHWGQKNQLSCCGYTNQANFLLSLGLTEYLGEMLACGPANIESYRRESFLKRALLIDMGNKFKVLIQQKGGLPANLMGLRLQDTVFSST